MVRMSDGWLAAVCLGAAACVAPAGDAPEQDETKAGPDFAVQGEYAGEAGGQKLGAQVIALGGGTFHTVFFPGGLPGDGSDGKTRIEKTPLRDVGKIAVDTKTEGDKTVVDSVYKATISGDAMKGETDKGEKFELKKVLRKSPTLELKQPEGALVIFDGSGVDKVKGRMTDDKLLMQGATTKDKFGSGTLHVEFRIPFMPAARGQGRGNSGVYLQSRYEVQVLDSFGLPVKDNECGGVYSICQAAIPMSFPPLSWQTYDIEFTVAEFDGAKKVKDALFTVKHNGVLIHKDVKLTHTTTAAPIGKEGAETAPLYLQDHGNPVRYRNVWFVEKK